MQSLARKNEWPLDKMNLTVDVTKKFKEEFNQPAREGAYVYGLYMEGTERIHTPLMLYMDKRERERERGETNTS